LALGPKFERSNGEDRVVFGAHIAVGSYFIVGTLINNAELFV